MSVVSGQGLRHLFETTLAYITEDSLFDVSHLRDVK